MNRRNAALIRSGIMFARAGWPLEESDHWPAITHEAHKQEAKRMTRTGRNPQIKWANMHATRHNPNK